MFQFRISDLDSVRITKAEDIAYALAAFREVAFERGYEPFFVGDVGDGRALFCDEEGAAGAKTLFYSNSEEVGREYTSHSGDNPILKICRREDDAFLISGDSFHTSSSELGLDFSSSSKLFLDDNSRSLIVCPIHMSAGRTSAVIFALDNHREVDIIQEFEEYKDLFQIFSRIFLVSYFKLSYCP